MRRAAGKQIEAALARGCDVQIRFVYCPWPNGGRAISCARGKGNGRIVPLQRAAGGHYQSARTVIFWSNKFECGRQVEIAVFDNTVFDCPVLKNPIGFANTCTNPGKTP
jgi:hypothetical protein